MKNNRTIITTITVPKKQQGVVLIVALIMLLAITILGVSAVKRSSMDTQVAGNGMYTMLVYQGAESAIARSMTGGAEQNIKDAAASANPLNISAQLPEEDVTGGGKMKSKGTVRLIDPTSASCPITSVANSVGMTCQTYEVEIHTNLAATAANAKHIEARALLIAK